MKTTVNALTWAALLALQTTAGLEVGQRVAARITGLFATVEQAWPAVG
jgi:hypothetical protein